tara:strand:- start:406 stop:1425 length:1020 start_codon:yes stop_codon:yes gene_type:complete
MKISDFDYDLPQELIANYPLATRSSSRLLVYLDKIEHKSFFDLVDYFHDGDLLVVNNTSVIPARLFGKKGSGGNVEIFLERLMEDNRALVQIKSGNSPKDGTIIYLDDYEVECISRKDNFFIIQFNDSPLKIFNQIGHVPLPPYIKRPDEDLDRQRYATIYEDKRLQDSVAAPTAGLHFDQNLLDQIKAKKIDIENINLSVGAGTFQPVKSKNIEDHDIHEEYVEVSSQVVEKVNETKLNGGRVIAVGTTAARALESAFIDANKREFKGFTKLFIYPGYKFKAIDMLVTNFHLPKSSLLMLVSAFIGFDQMKMIYETAVAEKYRFLSYGDAMLLKKNEI